MTDIHRRIEAVWKLESAKIIAGLTRMVRDVGLAEELTQDALVAALEQWPSGGIPDNPGAWLMAIAKRRAVDHIRRAGLQERSHEQLTRDPDQEPARDDMLRLIFMSCHPMLPTQARLAMTLRLVGGLTAEEIARAFLTTKAEITARIAAAKRKLTDQRVPFDLPEGAELAGRLNSVLEVIYLIFNEGYSATSGDELIRSDLCHEALRLGRLLAELAPGEAEVHGLVALMEIQASRAAARTGPDGEPVPLHEQNRGRWDRLLIRRGFTAMLRAREVGGPPGPHVLQAAIAVCHAQASTAQDTDWAQIAALYDALARLLPTPVVRLNRAVAVGQARGPQAGLEIVEELITDPALRDYHLAPSVRGDLLARLGRRGEAQREFERAAAQTSNAAEREFLLRRAGELSIAAPAGPTLGSAAREFLARDDLDPETIRSYGQTLRRLCLALGDRLPLGALTVDDVSRVFATTWGGAAAATWNRHRSAVRSFSVWTSLEDLAAGLDRRVESRPPTRPLSAAQLAALWERPGVALRERTLWRLLHESSAPVGAVLALNVENLDLDDRRAASDRGWVNWRSGAARLLPDLVGDRSRGPLFLAERRPAPARPAAESDLCPETGHRRLSYARAEYLFKQATKTLDPQGVGFTLSQLRRN